VKTVSLRSERGVVCERCDVASTPLTRMRGLLGRRGLDSGEGLFLRPASSVHTFFMRFPIDVAFLGRDGAVLKIVAELGPWRTAGARGAKAAVELPAGEAARVGLKVGDRLESSAQAGSASGPAAGLPPVSA
jgi:uncharacterized membrane protein (UPF0127 family)